MEIEEEKNDWIAAAFDPQCVVIIGASENPEKIGGRPIKYMLQHGFKGRIYAINPMRNEVQGLKAWPDLKSLPEVPDVAIICIPGEAAIDAVRICAELGVKLGVIISSGFGETGEEGKVAQDRMLSAAKENGMRLIGPNTQGTVNFATGTIASFASLIGEVPPMDGPVAIVSQSGAMSILPYALLRSEDLGVRHAHATGNECDLSVADLAWAVAGDPGVKLILLYLESIPNPSALIHAARRAAQFGIPILALKAGVSSLGQIAASSHTGAIATEDKVIDAFMRQNGIVRVPDARTLVRSVGLWLKAIDSSPQNLVPGLKVVVISNSGACCVMAADAAARYGLDMQPFSQETRAELDAILPNFANSINPVDLTAALLSNSGLLSEVLQVISKRELADAYFISLPMSGKGYDIPRFAQDTNLFSKTTGKPIVLACPLESTREIFRKAGVVTFEHDEDAMAAIGELLHGQCIRAEALRLATLHPAKSPNIDLASRKGFLSEYESLAIVSELGISVVSHALCKTEAELLIALKDISAPWVIKACSANIPHKTEYGLVRIGLRTVDEALKAFREFHIECIKLSKPLDGIIVASMLKSTRELMLGARWDDRFGAVVIAGDGGKYAEAMPDVATVIYSFDETYLVDQLSQLRMAPLWDGVRGEQGLPLEAIARAAVTLGAWVHEQEGRVLSLDINPLMAGPGDILTAVDALIELAP